MPYIKMIERLLNDELPLEKQVALVRSLSPAIEEGAALADIALYLRAFSHPVSLPKPAIDIVGTGGDGFNTLNFSTLSALLLSSCKVSVAKHGAKASTSQCGSFDLLQELGVCVPNNPDQALQTFNKHNLVFLFAAFFNPILKKVLPARKALACVGEKTIFNCLGPLLNPAAVPYMLTGVYTPKLIPIYAEALKRLGVSHAYVVHSMGLDEFSVLGRSCYARIAEGEVEYGELDSTKLGLPLAQVHSLSGSDARCNALESMRLLQNTLTGPKRDTLLLNAGAALEVSRQFKVSLKDCIQEIDTVLNQGLAYQKLLDLKEGLHAT